MYRWRRQGRWILAITPMVVLGILNGGLPLLFSPTSAISQAQGSGSLEPVSEIAPATDSFLMAFVKDDSATDTGLTVIPSEPVEPTAGLVTTRLTANISSGVNILFVESTEGFSVGDSIQINPGGLTQEERVITALDPLFTLNQAVLFDHQIGELVIQTASSGPTPAPTPGVPTPTPGVPTPTPDPGQPTPTPDPGQPTPTPDPGQPTPTPTPDPGDPTPTPDPGDPTPTPDPGDPTPTPTVTPSPTPMATPDFTGAYSVSGTVNFSEPLPGIGDNATIDAGTLTLTQSGTSVTGSFDLAVGALNLSGAANLTASNGTDLSGTFVGDPFTIGVIQCGSATFSVTATGTPSGDPPLITLIVGDASSGNICPGGLGIDGTGATLNNFNATR